MIHQYKLNGYNIVLDVYSGSVHAVDEQAYAAIALVDAGHPRAEAADLLAKKYADHPEVTAEDINDCFDDIEELKANGKLFAEDISAAHAFDFKNRSPVVKAPHLQAELRILLCRPGQVPRPGRPDEL